MGRISIDVGKKTDESLVIHAFSTATERKWEYSVDGSSWEDAKTYNSSTATIIIENLEPNTEHKIGVRTNILNAEYIQIKTLYPLSIYSPSDVYIDSENPQLTFTANIPTSIDLQESPYVGFYNVVFDFYRVSKYLFQIGAVVENGKVTITFDEEQKDLLLQEMPNSKDLVFTMYASCNKKGSKYFRETWFTFHCKTSAENSAPILTDFVYKDGNTGLVDSVTGNNQILIQNQSGLVVTITPAEPRNYATISAYTVTVGNVSVSTVEERVPIGRIDLSGSVPIVVTAIDSRGYTATLTKIVEFIPYKDIEISELTIDRINSVERTVYIKMKSSITPIYINEVNRNSLKSVLYQTMRTNGEEVSEILEIPKGKISETDNEISINIGEWLEFDEESSYYIAISIQDQLTKDEETVTLNNGRPVMSWRKGLVGINNNNPQFALDIIGDLNLTGRILINGEEINVGGTTE